MYMWEAALVVLVDAGPNAELHYVHEIWRQIKERGLCHSNGKWPWKTMRTVMRREGRHFISQVGGRSGKYTLRSFSQASAEVDRIKDRYPRHFKGGYTAPLEEAASVSVIASATLVGRAIADSTGPGRQMRMRLVALKKRATGGRKSKPTRARPAQVEIPPQLIAEEVHDPEQFIEGATVRISINQFERDPHAREACIRHWGDSCSVCGFRFQIHFGKLGRGFIHVHHLKPLSTIKFRHQIDPIEDMRPVCPNCHAMLHKASPPLSIEELRKIRRAEQRRRARTKRRR